MANVQRNRVGNWEARVRRFGIYETRTFDTKEGAEKWANGFEAQIKAGATITPRVLREGPRL